MKQLKHTINELFEMVYLIHWASDRYIQSGHADEVKWNYDKHLKPTFGSMKAEKVTRAIVRDWHQKNSDSPYAANRSLQILSTIFNKAIENEHFDKANPCKFVKQFRERKRKRYATKEEIQKIGQCLYREERTNPVRVAFLFTLLFTGARPRSIERARYDELTVVDEYGMLSFHGKSSDKTGEDETLILPPIIMDMIGKLPRRKDGLIFGCNMPRDLWIKIRNEVGCPDLWARDLRRTFATVGRSSGVAMDKIAELLNHQSEQTTKIYAKLWDEERVKAVREISDKMTQLLEKKVSGE